MIDNLPPLREIIARYDLSPKKALGQNFLLDLNLTTKVARTAGTLEGFNVVEIGPGQGGLTRALLAEGAQKIITVERDRRCLPALEEISEHYPGRLKIIEGDALSQNIIEHLDGPAKIVANLPYNIATPLLTTWLSAEPWPAWFCSMTLMFQREVAQRICAEPGTKTYGRLSVLSGWRCDCKLAFDISPKAFTPPPKVVSSVVHLVPRAEPLPCELKKLETITRTAFGQRRKMLRAALKPFGGEALLDSAGIEGNRRAETLSVAEFVALANAL